MSGFDESPFLTYRPPTADGKPSSRSHTAISADGDIETAKTAAGEDKTVAGDDKTVGTEAPVASVGQKSHFLQLTAPSTGQLSRGAQTVQPLQTADSEAPKSEAEQQ